MTEGKRTALVLDTIRRRRPDGFVWKINERMFGGKPDVLIIGTAAAAWYEAKRVKPGVDPMTEMTELQKQQARRLTALGQQVFTVGLHEDGTMTVWRFEGPTVTATTRDAWQVHALATCWGLEALVPMERAA